MIDPHRSRRIEYELLRMVVQCQDHLGYHASLGTLADFFRPNIPDIENRELVDALKRLQPKYLSLCKYVSGGAPCVKYPAEIDNEEIFFWRTDGFRMRRTPETAPRSEELVAMITSQPDTKFFPVPGGWRVETPDEQFASADKARRAIASETPTERAQPPGGNPSSKGTGLPFIAGSRVDELRKLSSPDFDFQKLIRLCDELNSSYDNGNYYATAMLTRGVLDHVPPLFGQLAFAQVSSNYSGGGRSFKDAMQHLEGAARKVSDAHLHLPIRKSETLPTPQQVYCGSQIDALLSEIIRIMK